MRSRGPYCRARFPGISPVVCDVTQWRNWVMSRQRETPRGAPRTVPSSSGKRNTVLIATLTERGFFSFVEATSHFLGSCEKLCRVSLSFWNVIRLPVTRSVGLKGQGGPGVSETGGGARDVIDRRHEASPRVTERPSATLRLRHPGAPAPDKKDPHQLVFASLLSRVVVGGKVFVWRPACGRQRRPAVGGSAILRSRGPYCRARFPGISPVVCDVTQWRNWVMSRQRETPRGAPRTVPSSSGKRNTVLIATLTERGFFSFVEATSHFLGSCEKLCRVSLSFWNVIRLPVTRSVGLKGQGGPGVSETGGGARDVIDRRHEASPRVTERPSATLRLRHPVPALPPFWLLAPAALAVRTLLGPRVASPTNGLFRLFKPPPTVCPERGSVLVTVVSGSRLF